jgi:hypothetical protein
VKRKVLNYQSNQGACVGMACQENEGENLISVCLYYTQNYHNQVK